MPSLATPMDGVAFFYKEGSSMKTIVVSAKTVSGTVGLILCYSVSLYFFWNSQTSLSDFFVNPENSHFTRLLHTIFGYGPNRGYPNKTIGVIAAFLSIHASWYLRYKAGRWVEFLINLSLGKAKEKEWNEGVKMKTIFPDENPKQKLENIEKNEIQVETKNSIEKIEK